MRPADGDGFSADSTDEPEAEIPDEGPETGVPDRPVPDGTPGEEDGQEEESVKPDNKRHGHWTLGDLLVPRGIQLKILSR